MQKLKGKTKEKALSAHEPCPCDSGFAYDECCKIKGIKYVVNSKGDIVRRLKVHPELKKRIDDAEKRFKVMFGRRMAKDDIFLFDHFLNGEEDRWQTIRAIGQQAKTPDHLIFAWRRSGFIVSEHSLKIMSDAYLDEWQEAVEEFFSISNEGYDPFHVFTYLDPATYEHYKKCVLLIENVVITGFNSIRRQRRFPRKDYYFQFLIFCSALNSYRTVNEMFKTRYDDDCLGVLRGIYEQYLRIKLLRLQPAAADRFEAAINALVGIYKHKLRRDGTIDYSTVVNPSNGEEFRITFSNFNTVKISDFDFDRAIFREMYSDLSDHVHHDIAGWALKNIATNSLSLDRDQDSIRAIALTLFVAILIFYELLHLEWLFKKDKRDIRHTLLVLEKAARKLIQSKAVREHAYLPSCLLPALDKIKSTVGNF